MQGIEPAATVADKHLLAALDKQAHCWLEHAVKWHHRPGGAEQGQSWERLFFPIEADSPLDPLYQMLAVGVHPLGLANFRLLDHHVHHTLFSCFSRASLGSVAESDNHFA